MTGATPHDLINPESLLAASGYTHAVVASPGRTVYLGGQAGLHTDGTLVGPGLMEQLDQALANVVTALRGAGAEPEHLVFMQIFVTDADEYRAQLAEAGEAWRRHLGRHYPALALFQVTALFDPGAKIELVGVAVIPD